MAPAVGNCQRSPIGQRRCLIGQLFRPDPTSAVARRLYEAVVAQARQPVFFAEWEVPDTVDGRFEMVALHAHLLLRRLRDGGPAADLAQALFDVMFADMDASLREMGAGDLGVGRRVKQMATAFYGRMAAYDAGLASSETRAGAAAQPLRHGLARQPLESPAWRAIWPAGGGAGDEPMTKNHTGRRRLAALAGGEKRGDEGARPRPRVFAAGRARRRAAAAVRESTPQRRTSGRHWPAGWGCCRSTSWRRA